ncbi:hypothetical protein V1515DRAFT_582896 [Lipomyces mesembrius]
MKDQPYPEFVKGLAGAWQGQLVVAWHSSLSPESPHLTAQNQSREEPEQAPALHEDAVIDLASELWPLIVELAVTCNSSELSANITSIVLFHANLFELELCAWEVPVPVSESLEEQEVAMQVAAKVYQIASQIYLMSIVGQNDTNKMKALVKDGLEWLGRLCTLDGNMAALLWPIFVVASECVDVADRVFVKAVLTKLSKRQGMGKDDRVMRVVEKQ